MFKLNLKIALRNLWKNKTSSLINVIGLAIGLAACLMLLVYVSYEWNFDRQAKNADRTYTVINNIKDEKGGIVATFEGSATALAPAIKQQIPEVSYISRTNYYDVGLLSNGDKAFRKSFRYAEPDIFEIYDFKFTEGSAANALNDINSIILTESTAKLLFGTSNALNKAVRYDNKTDLKVTGIIKDLPYNSSFNPDFILPWAFYASTNRSVKNIDWNNFSFITLLVLKPGADADLTNKKINALVSRNVKTPMQSYFIFSLNDLYLRGNFENGKSVGGNIEKIWLFMGLAIGILLIACINFMNLATAKSEKRAKEVAIKKTIGANRSSLVIQFLTESLILTLIAAILAIMLAELLLPSFNNLLNTRLSINYLNIYSWLSVLAAALITGLVAGSYPAFYLSSFNPIQNLRRFTSNRFFDFNLRQLLVVGQFCFSIILIVGTLVIYQQVEYAKNKSLGFDKDVLVEMPQQGLLKEKYNLLKDKLIKAGAVESITQLSIGLSHSGASFSDLSWPGMMEKENKIPFNRIATSYDFIKTSGIKLASGRDFSEKYASDSNAVLLSSAALKIMGLKSPIGERIKIFGETYNVIGVFDDFVWDTPFKSNDPMIVYFKKEYLGNITMRLNAKNDLEESINKITKVTKELNPAYPVEIAFLSSIYNEKFESEQRLGVLSNLFGGLAIFVSCLGLYGLVTYSAEQRTKEFGVRKVLGATIFNLMQLLSLSFVKMIVISIVIAVPLSYYLMNKWLMNFEFRTEISWWIIPLAGFGTLLMALITVSFQAYKSANANPVKALKYE